MTYMNATLRRNIFDSHTGQYFRTDYVDILFKDKAQLKRLMDDAAKINHRNVEVSIEKVW